MFLSLFLVNMTIMASTDGPRPSDDRYGRQVILTEVGAEGQERLANGSALVIGVGALGTVVASALVRAGVGHVRLVDRDLVELSNLQRQVLFDESDVGSPKAVAAVERLQAVNHDVVVEGVVKDVGPTTVEDLLEGMDIVVDGTDNLESRFLLNDACVKHGVPWVYGGAVATLGMTLTIVPGDTPCLRCCLPSLPPPGSLATCDRVGVLNTLPLVIGALETSEALKLILGREDFDRDMVVFDAWRRELRRVEVARDPRCGCCGEGRFEFLEGGRTGLTSVLCGRRMVQVTPAKTGELSLPELSERLGGLGEVRLTEHTLTLALAEHELVVFRDGRALVRGTDDPSMARSLYARYIGA